LKTVEGVVLMLTISFSSDEILYLFRFQSGAYLVCPVGPSDWKARVVGDSCELLAELLEHVEDPSPIMAQVEALEVLPALETT
jgi:hypothetical protein